MRGLQGGDFYFSVTRNPPETYKDLLRKATSYSQAKQLNLARKATTGSVPETNAAYQPRDKRPNDYAYDRSVKRRKGELGSSTRKGDTRPEKHNQYTNYTPLNKSKDEIFALIASELPNTKRARFPYRGRRDEGKYCKYHRDYGHHTDDCYQLKEEIEALIRQGKLKEYVTGNATPMDTHARTKIDDK
ncbi:unnamed protein product [Prunus armeniaca]|uniref:Retrotransposon gag domain-containing protein n=1 Tax=Prunus armeniaca TaxID=36596 RepID=A0A6J5V551_PRUAR|nr:unnamed protein product [Prunus armeniaca]